MALEFESLLRKLADLSPQLETGAADWPATQLRSLADAGVLGWVIPREFGGSEISPAELVHGYVQLASACLATTFVLTQRNGACQRIAGSQNGELKSEILPGLCTADVFATVGISHLTTSRQHLREPAVRVGRDRGGFRLHGTVPWVTGACHADYVVTGGTYEDGRQVLIAVPMQLPGIAVDPPPPLLALNSSRTGSISFDDAFVEDRWLLAGPVEGVMKQGTTGGTGSLTTSALAVGAAAGTLQRLEEEAHARPDLSAVHDQLLAEHAELMGDLDAAAIAEECGSHSPEVLRTRANSLVLRVAHAYLTAAKGAGFITGHPAERAVREAAFFLVWSCPQPVQAAALREFACIPEN